MVRISQEEEEERGDGCQAHTSVVGGYAAGVGQATGRFSLRIGAKALVFVIVVVVPDRYPIVAWDGVLYRPYPSPPHPRSKGRIHVVA